VNATASDRALLYLGLPWNWDIKFDAESDCWIATVGEMPDFFAAGATPGEAALNAREALQSHICGYLESGTEIPLPLNRFIDMDSENSEAELVEVAA
jgi:predicted RNase H-like HicB family nuclease